LKEAGSQNASPTKQKLRQPRWDKGGKKLEVRVSSGHSRLARQDQNNGAGGKPPSLDDERKRVPVWLRSPKSAREVADGIGEVS